MTNAYYFDHGTLNRHYPCKKHKKIPPPDVKVVPGVPCSNLDNSTTYDPNYDYKKYSKEKSPG